MRPVCLCNFLGHVCVTAQSFGGVTAPCLLGVHPNPPWGLRGYLLSLGCLEHPKRLCLQFCHWVLLLYIFFYFSPKHIYHMNQPLSTSWHFKLTKWCFYRSVLRNNAVLLCLKNICVFCGIGLLFITQHMCFHVILLEWAFSGLHWREESKIRSHVWIGWQREIRNSLRIVNQK